MGTMMMTAEEVGAYIRLLCYQWDKGAVPDDDALIAKIGGCGGNAVASIRHKFGIAKGVPGLQNERLEEVRKKQQEYSKKQANRANAGWASRKKNAAALPAQCSPSSSPTSNNKGIEIEIPHWLTPAWAEWKEARKQAKRRPYTALGAKKQVAALVEMGEARAVAAINYSIRQGYQGIYEESANKPANATDQRPNSRRYASTADYSKVTSHGLDRQLGRVPPEPSGSG